jgi:hypothetical protein
MITALALFRRVCGSVAVLWFLLFSSSSFALIPKVNGFIYYDGVVTMSANPKYSPEDVFFALAAAETSYHLCFNYATSKPAQCATAWPNPFTGTGYESKATAVYKYNKSNNAYASAFTYTVYRNTGLVCPANSTLSGSQCACNAEFVEDGTHTQCIPVPVNPCTAIVGQDMTFNGTVGYNRSPVNTEWPELTPTGAANGQKLSGIPQAGSCINGCVRNPVAIEDFWISSEPGPTGLYRISVDATFRATGQQCAAPPSNADPVFGAPTTAPACNGFLGSVNGKTTCVSTSTGSTNIVAPYKSALIGNPVAGADSGNGANIPILGSGQNSGGPLTSKDGSFQDSSGAVIPKVGASAPSGRASAPGDGTEQLNCGAPGQPVCAVKMDESGVLTTPKIDGLDKIDAAKSALDSGIAGAVSSEGKDTSWGITPSWLNHVGTCSPVVLWTLPAKMGAQQITFDICPLLPTMYLLMNWLWVVWTFFIVVGMVYRVTTKAAV